MSEEEEKNIICDDTSVSNYDTKPLKKEQELLLNEKEKKETHSYSQAAGFATVINYIIGTGVFGIPFAYFTGGLPLSAIILIGFFIINVTTMNYLIDSMARSEGRKEIKENGGENEFNTVPVNELKFRLFDYTTLGEMWGGQFLRWFNFACLVLYLYGSLWAYAATSVSTLTTLFWMIYGDTERCIERKGHWECQLAYYISLAIYSIIVISLSFIDLSKQGKLQMALTFYRFFAFSVMLITCIVQLIVSGPIDSDISFLYTFKWVGFGTAFTHTAFALTCHQNLPDAVTPVNKKKYLFYTTAGAMLLSAAFYFLIGFICSWTFGSDVLSPITNAWSKYTGLSGGWGKGETQWYAYPIQYIVLLFPVVNLCNSYPLLGTTLSTNIQTCFTYSFREKHNKITQYASLAIAYLPPLLLTCAIGSLQVIFDVTGLLAIFLAFTIPATLEILSIYKNKKDFGKDSIKTPYTFKVLANYILTGIVVIVSFILLGLSLYFLIAQLVTQEGQESSSN
ncbi:hypothetical protein ENUP19_0061G0144 [Entamoeba nuttalli]|uniref:Amino acid transporter, putative n=2 Tax=Entamoeba nuttalli TaxID=412467 RepID=K2GZI5_ENTNP|nr:amino acid transporter, putative [Entamoeba nuttalli P19]EKE39372.1 amino acid transporter, putative [Entamoeba nuttalli P19]|eukprot:XP_008858291.1 amino acid transporter, putative [Entamoeba nuttalli P19]